MGGFNSECTAGIIFNKVPTCNIIELIDVASPDGVRLDFAAEHLSSWWTWLAI
jgi:hypothetical protein